MCKIATPELPVSDAARAGEFCTRLGFRSNEARSLLRGFTPDGATLHVSSFPGDGVSGNVAYFEVDDAEAFRAERAHPGFPYRRQRLRQQFSKQGGF